VSGFSSGVFMYNKAAKDIYEGVSCLVQAESKHKAMIGKHIDADQMI